MHGQAVAVLAKQQAREVGKVLTEVADGWGSSTCWLQMEGRTKVGLITRRSGAVPRPRSVDVEDGARNHKKSNETYGQTRKDTVKVRA